jgi:hypothetical protein
MQWIKRIALAVLALAASAGALSAPVVIGRASTQTPADQDWQIRSLDESSMGITSGADGQMQLATTALWLASPAGVIDAVLVFRGSKNSYPGRLQWSASCEGIEPGRNVFVRNQWRNMWSEWRDDCLVVAGPFDLGGTLHDSNQAVEALMAEHKTSIDGGGYIVRGIAFEEGGLSKAVALER